MIKAPLTWKVISQILENPVGSPMPEKYGFLNREELESLVKTEKIAMMINSTRIALCLNDLRAEPTDLVVNAANS